MHLYLARVQERLPQEVHDHVPIHHEEVVQKELDVEEALTMRRRWLTTVSRDAQIG